jgi:hypothetical protein
MGNPVNTTKQRIHLSEDQSLEYQAAGEMNMRIRTPGRRTIECQANENSG